MIEPVAASASPVSDDIVAGTGFFAELAAPQRARVASLGRIETHRQDTPIYNIGDAAADFYVLVDGMVRFSIGLGSRRTAAGESQSYRRGHRQSHVRQYLPLWHLSTHSQSHPPGSGITKTGR